jgi:hypothetical protein
MRGSILFGLSFSEKPCSPTSDSLCVVRPQVGEHWDAALPQARLEASERDSKYTTTCMIPTMIA